MRVFICAIYCVHSAYNIDSYKGIDNNSSECLFYVNKVHNKISLRYKSKKKKYRLEKYIFD